MRYNTLFKMVIKVTYRAALFTNQIIVELSFLGSNDSNTYQEYQAFPPFSGTLLLIL